jgi:hypothetical protein
LRALARLLVIVAVGVAVVLTFGVKSPISIAIELAAIAAMLLLDRLSTPVIDRWARGRGEPPPAGVRRGRQRRAVETKRGRPRL